MAIDPSWMKRAKQMIEKFKREVCRELSAGGSSVGNGGDGYAIAFVQTGRNV
jgi:hypothetical protein